MRRNALAAVFLLTGSIFLPEAMRGQTSQFTFIVPVRLANLHEGVESAAILCNLYKAADQPPALTLEGPISIARACPTCSPNDFAGNVTVQGALPDGFTIKPEEISRYDCNLTLNGDFPRQTTDSRTPIELQAQMGTLFTGMVQGTVP